MKFAAIYNDSGGNPWRRVIDLGSGPLHGAAWYWAQCRDPDGDKSMLLCLVRLDSPPGAGEPEVIVNGEWTDMVPVRGGEAG